MDVCMSRIKILVFLARGDHIADCAGDGKVQSEAPTTFRLILLTGQR